MKIKRFDQINENLAYRDFFGREIDHDTALKSDIKNGIINIIMDEENISEKNFTAIDELSSNVENKLTEDILNKSNYLYNQGKRMNYICEMIYDEHFK